MSSPTNSQVGDWQQAASELQDPPSPMSWQAAPSEDGDVEMPDAGPVQSRNSLEGSTIELDISRLSLYDTLETGEFDISRSDEMDVTYHDTLVYQILQEPGVVPMIVDTPSDSGSVIPDRMEVDSKPTTQSQNEPDHEGSSNNGNEDHEVQMSKSPSQSPSPSPSLLPSVISDEDSPSIVSQALQAQILEALQSGQLKSVIIRPGVLQIRF
ncbi:hypothetical protein F4778DRAFT_758362 [Xylariomycetidae sp. FL2044]|nr:hypothetical protein F4778DRAFT_758362 [Xylariomycetidae sp. FL2044]